MGEKNSGGVNYSDGGAYGALTQLRAYLAQRQLRPNDRLPPERSLCTMLGVTRTALRNALAVLEQEGRIWRHVGRGTFIGRHVAEDVGELSAISTRTSPPAVMEARLAIEPEVARLAALHATAADIEAMQRCMQRTREAREWRAYETWDNHLHRSIAVATHNPVLLSLFDTLNTVRRAVVWDRRRAKRTIDASHHSFTEHEHIVRAIREGDMDTAAALMRQHLAAVREHLADTPGTPTSAGR